MEFIWAAAHAHVRNVTIFDNRIKTNKRVGKKGLRGYYFTYEQYRELAKIKEFDDVKSKITIYGYPTVKSAENIQDLIPLLKASNTMTKEEKGCLFSMILEPIFWIVIAFLSCQA